MTINEQQQIKLMQLIDGELFSYVSRHKKCQIILLLDVVNWHKLQSLKEIPENEALIDGMRKGKYKGVDVLLITDPFFGLKGRAPLGNVILAGSRYE